MTLLGKRAFADVIKLRILRRDHRDYVSGFNVPSRVLIREAERDGKRRSHVKIEGDTRDAGTTPGTLGPPELEEAGRTLL